MNEGFDIVKHLKIKNDTEEEKLFKQVAPAEFVECRNGLSEKQCKYLSMYSPEEIEKLKIKVFLSSDKKTGFGIMGEEMVNIFSLEKGNGKFSVIEAINRGGKKLNCFDKEVDEIKGLPDYYKEFNFLELRREKNWEEGEPDVVYMGLPEVIIADKLNQDILEAKKKHLKEASEELDKGDYSSCSKEFIESMGEPTEKDLEKIL